MTNSNISQYEAQFSTYFTMKVALVIALAVARFMIRHDTQMTTCER